MELSFLPVTAERWDDLEALFGERGAYAGCWCMFWRVPRTQHERQKGDGNRNGLKAPVHDGTVPGILAYDGDRPVGWCSLGRRDEFGPLQRSRVLKPVDDEPVWSIVCFYIHRDYQGQGMMSRLLDGAVEYAASQGAQIVEGYPVEPTNVTNTAWDIYMGVPSVFLSAGFEEVERRSPKRPIMRKRVA